MARRSARRSLAAAFTATALLAAACGGDDGGGESSLGEANVDDLAPEVRAAYEEAGELGLQFATSHDELVECAEEEGDVVIQTSTDEFDPIEAAFEEDYPDIDLEWVNLSGASRERFLLEVESGTPQRYDAGYPASEVYEDVAELFDWDLYGMAQAGVLDIPIELIDEERRTVMFAGALGVALVYNSELVDESELPTTWEDLADPKWHRDELGMAMDVDLNNVPVLADHPDWGIERVLELSEQMAANDPIFTDGHTAATLLVQAGEVAISPFVLLQSAMREVDKDPEGPLQVAFIEPVPVYLAESYGVFNDDLAEAPCAALLYIEWTAGDAAQQQLNDAAPLKESMLFEGSRKVELIGDAETHVIAPSAMANLPDWIAQVQEAFDFPQAVEEAD